MRPNAQRFTRVLIALTLVAATSCVTPRHIRDAQSAFNDAARAENADRFADGEGLVVTGGSAVAGYRVALGLVDSELAEHETDLRQENLLGTALLLRTLCLWRIADLESAAASPPHRDASGNVDPSAGSQLDDAITDLKQRQQDASSGVTLGPRDRALLTALPGLMDHDNGLRQGKYADAQRYFSSAVFVYEAALKSPELPANHPLRTHLLLSKLATLRAWKYAAWDGAARGEIAKEKRNEVELDLLARFKATLAELGPAATENPALTQLVQRYAEAFGATWPPP